MPLLTGSIFHKFTHLPHYFQKHVSRRLEELYISVAILDFALAAVALFEPVYLYQLGYSLQHILLFFMLAYVAYFFLLPLGGKSVARYGPERNIAISTIMLIGYYAGLLVTKSYTMMFWVTPLLLAMQKTFYWPAYHVDFIRTSDQGERGKEFSALWSLSTIMNIMGPLVGGIVIVSFGFNVLFIGVIATIVLSNIPMFIQPAQYSRQTLSYWPTLLQPFRRFHLKTTLAYLGFGEEFVMQFIWPVFFILVVNNYIKFGGLAALATLVTALVTLYIGKVVDKQQTRRALSWGTWVTALVWLTRPFLRLAPSVFLSDTLGRIAKNTTFVPITATTYERALRERNVIPRAVFYEQGFALAKSFAPALIIVLSLVMPTFTAAFVLAGAMSLLYLLL